MKTPIRAAHANIPVSYRVLGGLVLLTMYRDRGVGKTKKAGRVCRMVVGLRDSSGFR